MSPQEFEEIYRKHFDPVYRFALSLTRDESRAEELTQETFFRALRAVDGYRGESSLTTWLCSIARNCFLSEARRAKPLPLEELPDAGDDAPGPEERALARDESRELHRALHALPEPYREVFTLRVFAQLSFREIGELFGKTDNWACVVYHRARARIKAKEGSS